MRRGADQHGQASLLRIQERACRIGGADGDARLAGAGHHGFGILALQGEADDGRGIAPEIADRGAGDAPQALTQTAGA